MEQSRGHHGRRTGILRNDLYAGRLLWNRQRFVKDPRTGRRLARPNPPELWVEQAVPELRIVDAALWQRVQDRLAGIRGSERVEKARATAFWEQRRVKHLLTGLVHCGVCGSAYASIGRDYIGCSRARRQGNCANRRSFKRAALEAVVLDGLKAQLMQPEHVREFIAALQEETNRRSLGREQQLALKRRELEEVTRKLDGLIEAIADGLRGEGLQHRIDDLEGRKKTLQAECATAPAPAPRLHPNLAELYRRKVEQLHESLAAPSIRHEALEVLRSLIETITVTPSEAGLSIELIGDIVRMVALPDGSGAHVPDPYARSVSDPRHR